MYIYVFLFPGVPESPKAGAGIPSTGRDASVVAGIVVAVFSGLIILAALVSSINYMFNERFLLIIGLTKCLLLN